MLKFGFCFYLKSLPFSWHSLICHIIYYATFHLNRKGEDGDRMMAYMLKEKKKAPENIRIHYSLLPSGKV